MKLVNLERVLINVVIMITIFFVVVATIGVAKSEIKVASALGGIHFWDIDETTLMQFKEKLLREVSKTRRLEADRIISHAIKMSLKYNVDPVWVISIMWVESNYNSKAKSKVGARGPMQLMPSTGLFLLSNINKLNRINHANKKSNDFISDKLNRFRIPYRQDLIREMIGRQQMIESSTRLVEESSLDIKIKINKSFSKNSKKITRSTKKAKAAREAKVVKVVSDPKINIEMAIIYLKYLFDIFDCPVLATVAYNMGPTWVKGRLDKNYPVGNDNEYLNKVRNMYQNLSQIRN
ncbi:MAG: transglycosylase SLT domain-containing protein [Oligoflexia bacterium]|nr:transglycosylase SLT domain-containing protein [Oligoflexia bacterium]